jgi:hypothetical protein
LNCRTEPIAKPGSRIRLAKIDGPPRDQAISSIIVATMRSMKMRMPAANVDLDRFRRLHRAAASAETKRSGTKGRKGR